MKYLNLNIGTRLALGFGGAFFLVCLALTVMLYSQYTTYTKSRELTGPVFERIQLSTSIKDANLENVINFMRLLSERDKAKQEAIQANIKEANARNNAAMERLRILATDEQTRATMQRIESARNDYVQARNAVLKLSMADASAAEVVKLWTGSAEPKLVPYRQAVDDLKRIQLDTVRISQDEVAAMYASSRNQAIAFCLVVALIFFYLARVTTVAITKPLASALATAEKIATGRLDNTIQVTSTDETGQLLAAMKTMQTQLADIVAAVRTGSEDVVGTANQLARATIDLSSRTEQQASSLEETAASMEEITTTVKGNAGNAGRASELAKGASAKAFHGANVVQSTVSSMDNITQSSKRIHDIISVMDGIAFQTNILALNAAVEAARAGDHGRGFAVVAAEVRNLAQRSAQSAKEIKALIGDSVEQVEAGSLQVNEAGQVIATLADDVQRVGELMHEIAVASAEQGLGIEQVNTALLQMDTVVQQNAAVVEQSAAAAESMRMQANSLLAAVSKFTILRDDALSVVHASQSGRSSRDPRLARKMSRLSAYR